MNWSSIRQPVATLARLVLGAVWIWAGVSKMEDPRAFLRAVRAYDATPEWLSKAIAYGLPVLEVAIGVALVLGLATRAAAMVSAFLLVVFIIGTVQAAARGIKLECGCFGGGGETDHTTYLLDVARDVGLLALAVILIIWPMTYLSLDSLLVKEHEVAAPSAKRVRRDPNALRKYEAMRKARAREEASKQRFVSLLVGSVIALTTVIGIAVQADRAKIDGAVTATNASASDGVTVGQANAPITLDVFEDFQCPICQEFEASSVTDINKLIASGAIKVRYHTMAFLDSQSSGNRYSSRAANASICASDVSTEAFHAYHGYLFSTVDGQKIQPEEGSDGRTDAQLEAYFKSAVPAATADQVTSFGQCVEGETHKALVAAITDDASKRGVTGTPTAYVDGKKLDTVTKDSVLAAITKEQAAGKTPPPATATPSTSGSATGTATGSAAPTTAAGATPTPTATSTP